MSEQHLLNLISPIDKNQFFEEYWDKQILHIKRDAPKYYEDIISVTDINLFLNQNKHHLFYPVIRMAKDGKVLPKEQYLAAANHEKLQIDPRKLFHNFHNGATMIIQFLKYFSKTLGTFTGKLEDYFHFKIGTNIYVTPDNSQGFPLHYDSHSTFILQIHGYKTWNLYGELEDLPVADSTKDYSIDFTTPKEVIELCPGDLLYIPRGIGHEARTSTEMSVHLTMSIFPHLWSKLMREALEIIKYNSLLRKNPLLTSDLLTFSDMDVEEVFAEYNNIELKDVIMRVFDIVYINKMNNNKIFF